MNNAKELYDSLVSNSEAAKVVSASSETMKISRCTGYLFGLPAPKHLKFGRTVRYKKSTLQAWLDQFEEQSSTSEKVGGAK
jgi:hypothetical protein